MKLILLVSTGKRKKPQAPRIHAPVAASDTRWAYRSRQVTAVKHHLLGYSKCFETIANNADGRWTKDINTADGFVNQLGSFKFSYWLHVFELVFKATDKLYNNLQSLKLNIGWARSEVDTCIQSVAALRQKADDIYDSVSADYPPPNKRRKIRNSRMDHFVGNVGGETVLTHKEEQRRVLNLVLDKLLRCLTERFQGIEQLKFLALLDVSKFQQYNFNFPNVLLRELQASPYAAHFSIKELRSDLMNVYACTGLPSKLDELVKHNSETQLQRTLPEFCRLCSLGLTLPLTVASAERSFSKLKIIKSRLRSTMADRRLCNLALMSLEKDIMDGLDVDKIIDRFASKKERRIDLIFKR